MASPARVSVNHWDRSSAFLAWDVKAKRRFYSSGFRRLGSQDSPHVIEEVDYVHLAAGGSAPCESALHAGVAPVLGGALSSPSKFMQENQREKSPYIGAVTQEKVISEQ